MPAPTAITLYTQPSCQPCKRIKFVLQREGVPFEEVDVSQDHQALEAIKELGYIRVPVMVVRPAGSDKDLHWSGLKPDLIREHCINPSKEGIPA